jgi:hypothetical protein
MLSNYAAKILHPLKKGTLLFRNNPREIAILPDDKLAALISLHQQSALFTIRV